MKKIIVYYQRLKDGAVHCMTIFFRNEVNIADIDKTIILACGENIYRAWY